MRRKSSAVHPLSPSSGEKYHIKGHELNRWTKRAARHTDFNSQHQLLQNEPQMIKDRIDSNNSSEGIFPQWLKDREDFNVSEFFSVSVF